MTKWGLVVSHSRGCEVHHHCSMPNPQANPWRKCTKALWRGGKWPYAGSCSLLGHPPSSQVERWKVRAHTASTGQFVEAFPERSGWEGFGVFLLHLAPLATMMAILNRPNHFRLPELNPFFVNRVSGRSNKGGKNSGHSNLECLKRTKVWKSISHSFQGKMVRIQKHEEFIQTPPNRYGPSSFLSASRGDLRETLNVLKIGLYFCKSIRGPRIGGWIRRG